MNIRSPRKSGHIVWLTILTLFASPALAQDATSGRLVTSSVGQAGERQDKARTAFGANPTNRINSRVQNRIASRLSSRIDRNAVAADDTLSSYTAARAAIRSSGVPER